MSIRSNRSHGSLKLGMVSSLAFSGCRGVLETPHSYHEQQETTQVLFSQTEPLKFPFPKGGLRGIFICVDGRGVTINVVIPDN